MKKFLFCTFVGLFLCSCSSTEKRRDPEPEAPAYEASPKAAPAPAEVVDLRALQSYLHLDQPIDVLGYREKRFNTCKVGAGYSSTKNCRVLTLVVLHFQLMCRDTDGTVSEVVMQENLQPIANKTIKWRINNSIDEVLSDSNGYTQIVMVAKDSQRQQRVRLTSGNDFLIIRAGEAKSIISPKNWCE
jgi:hypothetical protein